MSPAELSTVEIAASSLEALRLWLEHSPHPPEYKRAFAVAMLGRLGAWLEALPPTGEARG